jgi:catechol 2,3-dioxygenase
MNLGPASLIVTNLDRSVGFYQDAIGLQVHRRTDADAVLGAGADDLLELVEAPAARPAGRHAGLYHLALLFDSREELARAVQRLALSRTPIEGASDHGVSEAIYLADPDGNGLELYADRPRDQWPAPGPGERVGMYTRALDLHGLYGLVADDEPVRHAGAGLSIGHVHLHVSDLEAAVAHYQDTFGMDLMTRLPSAAFLSWDGYHHHLGLNTWRGTGIPGVPADAVGLRAFTVVDPDGDPREVVDPSGNRAVVQSSVPSQATSSASTSG